MARVEIPFVIQDTNGTAVNAASIQVYLRGTTTPVSVWAGETGGSPVGLPLTTTSNGRVNGWVNENQSLDLAVSGAGFTSYTQPWEAVRGDSQDDVIAANLVATASIQDNAVTTAKIPDNAITTAKILNGNVTSGKLAASSVQLVFNTVHTFAYAGVLATNTTNADVDFIPPFFVPPMATHQTVKLIAARHKINGGTSATCRLQKNGSDITGFTGISVTQTANTTDPADVALAANDRIALQITGVSGTPQNLSFSLYFEHTVTN